MTDPAPLARLVVYCYAHEHRWPVLRVVRRVAQARIRAVMAARKGA